MFWHFENCSIFHLSLSVYGCRSVRPRFISIALLLTLLSSLQWIHSSAKSDKIEKAKTTGYCFGCVSTFNLFMHLLIRFWIWCVLCKLQLQLFYAIKRERSLLRQCVRFGILHDFPGELRGRRHICSLRFIACIENKFTHSSRNGCFV